MIEALLAEFGGRSALTYEALPVGVVILRLAGAALLCAVIGFERESRDHAAGLRTNMMIGLAAASYAQIALALVTAEVVVPEAGGDVMEERVQVDPLRLVEAVTGGVAFLAAGMIVFAQGRVRGLSTGAAMWLSASAGLAAGLGLWLVALLAAGGGTAILIGVRALEKTLGVRGKRHYEGNGIGEDEGLG